MAVRRGVFAMTQVSDGPYAQSNSEWNAPKRSIPKVGKLPNVKQFQPWLSKGGQFVAPVLTVQEALGVFGIRLIEGGLGQRHEPGHGDLVRLGRIDERFKELEHA